MKTRRSMIWAGLLLACSACSPDAQPGEDSMCGERGEALEHDGETFCIYRSSIIETRFVCPAELSTQHVLEDRGITVCASGGLPGNFEEHLDRHGWEQRPVLEAPNMRPAPVDMRPVVVDAPDMPADMQDLPAGEDLLKLSGIWKFDDTARSAGKTWGYLEFGEDGAVSEYVHEPGQWKPGFKVDGWSEQEPVKTCVFGGALDVFDADTVIMSSDCPQHSVYMQLTPAQGLAGVFEVGLELLAPGREGTSLAQGQRIRAVQCVFREGEALDCGVDIPRHPDALEIPSLPEPTREHFQLEGHWDVEAVTGAIRIATLTVGEDIITHRGHTMPDNYWGMTLRAMSQPDIFCPLEGAYTWSETARELVVQSPCTDGVKRAMRATFDERMELSFELVGQPPAPYMAANFWAPLMTRRCYEGPTHLHRCEAFRPAQGGEELSHPLTTCQDLSEVQCGLTLGCEPIETGGAFQICERVECSRLQDEQSCFESPFCQGEFGPSSCMQTPQGEECTNDAVFKACVAMAQCERQDASDHTELCVRSGGEWVMSTVDDPGSCVCGMRAADLLIHGERAFSPDDGCRTERSFCEALAPAIGTQWIRAEFDEERVRHDLSEPECTSALDTHLTRHVWSAALQRCHMFIITDPLASRCELMSFPVSQPAVTYEAEFGFMKPSSACMMP